jgi:RND family efflux transporter MFP subunit
MQMSTTADRTKIGGSAPRPPIPQPDVDDDVSPESPSGRRALGKKLTIGALIVVGAVVAVLSVAASSRDRTRFSQALTFHKVSRGQLPIEVIVRGNLESRDSLDIKCEVEDIKGDGILGTTILWIIPNGTLVKKGELLVRLDTSHQRKRLDEQVLDTERRRAYQLQAAAKYVNQKSRNETSLANAELRVKLAELELQSFEDEEGGVFQLGLQDLEMQIQMAKADRRIKSTNLTGVEELYRLGYKSQGDVAQARLSALSAQRSLARAESSRKLKLKYEKTKERLRLQGAVDSARRNVLQVERNNEAFLQQALAAKHAADRALKKEEELLARYQHQVDGCMIHAPRDGMVVYGRGIREGEAVYQRRTIIMLPNLSEMQVKTMVHESAVNDIAAGLPATVRLDTRPGIAYKGSVESVEPMPDQSDWLNSDTKRYKTIITIDEDVEDLRPGMTAVAEIHVDLLKDVALVPVEAIVQIDGDDWCYVETGGAIERRLVKLGTTNERFVQIRKGLSKGERVVLNPVAIVDEAEDRGQTISPERTPQDVLR